MFSEIKRPLRCYFLGISVRNIDYIFNCIYIYILFTCLFFFCLSSFLRWSPGTSGTGRSYRDVHAGVSGPGTFGQLLDASNVRNILATQDTHVQLWIPEGVGTKGETYQWPYSNQRVEKRGWTIWELRRQEAVRERRRTLHQLWNGRHSPG